MDGHIHLGADFLGTDYQAWENFFTIYNECEEIFYKMSNRNGDLPRENISDYAQASNDTISNVFANGIHIKTKEDLDVIIEEMKDTRNRGVNFCNMEEGGIQTIEFRMPNGSIDVNVIRENIKLFGQLLNVSKQMSLNPEYKRNEYIVLKEHNLTEREKVESLLNLLFDDEQERDVYRNRWDTIKNNEIFEQVRAETPTFERGNYSMRKQVAPIYKETVVKDRIRFVQIVKSQLDRILPKGMTR